MKNKTVRIIVILVGLLFLNIEAAHAGLVHKFKTQILHEFSDFELFYIMGGIFTLGFLSYVIFTPVFIGKEKLAWYKQDYFNHNQRDFQSKREVIKKISDILKSPDFSNQPHS